MTGLLWWKCTSCTSSRNAGFGRSVKRWKAPVERSRSRSASLMLRSFSATSECLEPRVSRATVRAATSLESLEASRLAEREDGSHHEDGDQEEHDLERSRARIRRNAEDSFDEVHEFPHVVGI